MRIALTAGIAGALGSRPGSTRPHCPYPQEAVYDGVGNPNDAASFACMGVD